MARTKQLKQFSAATIDALGYYVYVLVDPLDNKVFYVGKGKGNRVFNHVEDVKKKMQQTLSITSMQKKEHFKETKIKEIISRGNEVLSYVVRYGLTSEHALLIESVLIDIFNHKLNVNLSDFDSLTNVKSGCYSSKGCISTSDLEEYYSSGIVADLKDGLKYLAINISILSNDPEEIYRRVRASWVLDKTLADQADYVLATHAGLIIGVYKLDGDGWIKDESQVVRGSIRYCFNEDKSQDMTEIRKRLVSRRLPKRRKKGAANPVWYIEGWN